MGKAQSLSALVIQANLIGTCACGSRSWMPVGGILHLETQDDPATMGRPESLRLLVYTCSECCGVELVNADMAARRLGYKTDETSPLRVVE